MEIKECQLIFELLLITIQKFTVFSYLANQMTFSETMVEDAMSKDHLNVSEARGNLMSDIKKCQGGACLKPVNLSSNSSKTLSSKNITE